MIFVRYRFFQPKKSWAGFDGTHKMPKWKNILKGIYDTNYENYVAGKSSIQDVCLKIFYLTATSNI